MQLEIVMPATRAEAVADCLRVASEYPKAAGEMRRKAKAIKVAADWLAAYLAN